MPRPDRRRLALVVAFGACVAVALLGAIGWPASAYRDGDFTQLWVQPRALIEGGDPYDSSWWIAAHERIGQRPENPQAVYPPHDAIAFLPFALLPLPYAAAAWIVAQLVAVAVAIGLLASRVLPRSGRGLFVAVGLTSSRSGSSPSARTRPGSCSRRSPARSSPSPDAGSFSPVRSLGSSS